MDTMRVAGPARARRSIRVRLALLGSIAMLAATPARAQYVEIQAIEVTPFVGIRFGGTFDVEMPARDVTVASLKDARSLGFSAGVRFDDYSLVEFRWTQSTSQLRFTPPFVSVGPAVGDVTLNQFHADFTREFPIYQVKGLRSYFSGSVGATHIGAAGDSFTRFSFGFGSGLKQFIGSRFNIRAEARWLPVLIDPEVGGFGCSSFGFGGCVVLLDGRLMQQFEMSIGPTISF